MGSKDQPPELNEGDNMGSYGSGLVKTTVETNPSENIINDAGLPLESQEGTEISVSTSPVEIFSDRNDDSDVKTIENEGELLKEQLDNGNKLVDVEARQVHAEENQLDDTLLTEERDKRIVVEEGAGEDSPKSAEAPVQSFNFDPFLDGDDDGTEECQAAFMRELENFHKERNLEFKPPKFYGEGLNCLK